MATDPSMLPLSARAVAGIHMLRKMQGVTAQALAERITAQGYSVTGAVISNYEVRRARSIPVDYLAHAAVALGTTVGALLVAQECPTCEGTPPAGFTCNSCGAMVEEDRDADA